MMPPWKYREAGVPLVVIAGKRNTASGSSRDWAAKGHAAARRAAGRHRRKFYENVIHREQTSSAMGVLPLEFKAGENRENAGP